jgi:hypothetical protein
MSTRKIIKALRSRGDDALADEIEAELGAVPPTGSELLTELGNLQDFVVHLDGVSAADRRIIEGSFCELKADIQKLVD